uniref:Uncharacterized protein n=1 Tax=Acrobeloides nanus TaxID=290746 RepID=A0A914EFR2_9BILA
MEVGTERFLLSGQCAANACTCDNQWRSNDINEGPENVFCSSYRFDKSFNKYVNKCKPDSTSEICLLFKQYVESNNSPNRTSKWGTFDGRFGIDLSRDYVGS